MTKRSLTRSSLVASSRILRLLPAGRLLVLDTQNDRLVLLAGGGARWQAQSRLEVARHPVQMAVDPEKHRCFISSLWSQAVTVVEFSEAGQSPRPLRVVASQSLPFPLARDVPCAGTLRGW